MPEPEAVPEPQKFDLGMRVVLHGLKSKPELNEKVGKVCAPTKDGRVPVEVSGTVLACRPENLNVAGYPTDGLVRVYDSGGAPVAALHELEWRDLQKLTKKLPLILDEATHRAPGKPCAVPAAKFEAQFSMFTGCLFADWEEGMWKNLVVAGGAVLASLAPMPSNYDRLKAIGLNSEWLEYDLYGQRRRFIDVESEPKRSPEQFMGETLCPEADIDIFVHGLDAVAAQAKLLEVFTRLRRTMLRTVGIENDVYFIKTPNTVTVGCGKRYRNVQIVARLYDSVEQILNGFDIDCCCVGWNGAVLQATPRAVQALRTKINTVDLQIRGECYEARLLKYVERGYAIGVPWLDRTKVDREHIAFKREKCFYDKSRDTLTGDGWQKWGKAAGLEKLLLAEALGRAQDGIIEYAFPGRRRRQKAKEFEKLHFRLKPYPALKDTYGGGHLDNDKAGNPIWPATTHLVALERGEGSFKVEWKPGNMPRKPQLWSEWCAAAYTGAKRVPEYDWKKMKAEREERERKQKEKEAAQRKAELETARKEGVDKAQEVIAKAKDEAKAAKTEAAKMAKHAAQLVDEHETLLHAREVEARETQRHLEQKMNAALEEAGEDKLCTVCLEEPKSVLFEPCGHICLCKTCAQKVDLCPFCRQKPTRRISAFL